MESGCVECERSETNRLENLLKKHVFQPETKLQNKSATDLITIFTVLYHFLSLCIFNFHTSTHDYTEIFLAFFILEFCM